MEDSRETRACSDANGASASAGVQQSTSVRLLLSSGKAPRVEGKQFDDSIAVESVSLRERVVEKLQEAIYFGRLAPGRRLVETELAQMLRVSRAPVREAINELRTQGIVMTIPRRGSYVRETTPRDVREIYEVRKALEIPAIEAGLSLVTEDDLLALDGEIERMLAHARDGDLRRFSEADVEFHRLTYVKCPNARLLGLIQQVSPSSRMVILSSLANAQVDLAETAELHRPLRDAIASRDADTVRRVFSARFEHDAVALIERIARADDRPSDGPLT
jgi:DNA-binding GntR family transcriptional regulator